MRHCLIPAAFFALFLASPALGEPILPSPAQQQQQNDRIIDNAIRSTQQDIRQLNNQLEEKHLERQQMFQQQPGQVQPPFPPAPPGFIPMPENNPQPAPVPKL